MLRQAIVDQVCRNAKTFPERIAIEEISGNTYTYGAAWRRVVALAHRLRDIGSGDGQRMVAILLPNSADAVLTHLACQLAGCVAVPINGALAAREIDEIFSDSGCRHVLTSEPFLAAVDAVTTRPQVIDCGEIPTPASIVEFRDVAAGDSPMVVGYTSGTTGRPKGAVFSNDAMFLRFLRWGWQFGLTEDHVLLIAGPMSHLSYSGLTLIALLAGARVRITKQFDAGQACTELAERCTFAFLVPTMMERVLDAWQERGRPEMSAARFLLSSGAPINRDLLAKALGAFPNATIAEAYGWSEGSWITYEVKRLETLRPQCVGWPMIGSDVVVFDDEFRPCGPHQPGEIAAKDLIGFSGYLNRPEETAAAYHDGFVLSGDVGVWDDDGRLRLVDRKKDMIVSGGENIYSAEVERALLEDERIAEAAVVGRPDPQWGEIVVAVIVPGDPSLTEEDVRTSCQKRLARYKVPKAVDMVDELPRNAMGKVQKYILRYRAAQPQSPATVSEAGSAR